MPPEILTLLAGLPATLTGALGYFLGRGKRQAETEHVHQQNKNLEFERLNKAMDELQELNREYREDRRLDRAELQSMREQHTAEMRAMSEQHARDIQSIRDQAAREQESYLKRITELEGQVAHLEAKLAEARGNNRKINPAKEG